jgi:hypothetical protein
MTRISLTLLIAGMAVSSHAARVNLFEENTYECADGTPIAMIDINGLDHTKPHVVMRELTHKVGGHFSQQTFEAEKRKLQDLDLFTDITVTCEPFSESINDMLGAPDEPVPEPVAVTQTEEPSPYTDTLSSFVTQLTSNTDALSSVFSTLSTESDSLSAFVARFPTVTDELSSIVSQLASNTDSLAALISRLSSDIGTLSWGPLQ